MGCLVAGRLRWDQTPADTRAAASAANEIDERRAVPRMQKLILT